MPLPSDVGRDERFEEQEPKLCFLDMDGVLVDFVGGASKVHNRETPYTTEESLGVWEIETLWGISSREFWEPLEYQGFWENLEKTPEADEIVEVVCDKFGVENIAILTALSRSVFCVGEKCKWIKKHYPQFRKSMIFTKAKQFLAGSNRFLIDDKDTNISSFNQAGGWGITVPRLWNAWHDRANLVIPTLQNRLGDI